MDEGVTSSTTYPGGHIARRNEPHSFSRSSSALRKMPETQAFSRRTGAEMGLYATEQNKSDILVKLKPRSHASAVPRK